jgi:hypothetical protein
MNIFNFLKSPKVPNGALEDYRDDTEITKDFRHEEVLAAAPPVKEMTYDEVLNQILPYFRNCVHVHNQNGAGSCVSHSIAAIAALEYVLENKLDHKAPKFSGR